MLKSWMILSLISGLSSASYASSTNPNFRHQGQAPRIQFHPSNDLKLDAEGERLVAAYLKAHAAEYGIEADLSNIRLTDVRHSLLGAHYHFQQTHRGFDVKDGEIVVSLDKTGTNVRMVFNNIVTQALPDISIDDIISADRAYDIAWNDLQVRGALQAAPQQRLVYHVTEGKAFLVYDVLLSVEAPYGAWQYLINATDGSILGKQDTLIYRRQKVRQPVDASLPLRNRQAEFAAIKGTPSTSAVEERQDGTALVFDPDPRTALNNATLDDKSPASAFEDAYVSRSLRDLEVNNGKFLLNGPWVKVVDFDSPRTAPSTSTTGNWDQKRGNNGFNDVMTYFHIDQSQRYMQSLGFTGDKGIQFASLPVDTDGVNGDDNSYFSPMDNRLSFGHGCVDDNEDADVILHEYGHAIQWSINNSWGGGDSGAMGEGFGDYWAGSYSLTTPNGNTLNPEWVFSFDGHNSCWKGRILNAHAAKYDPKRTYSAHTSIPGGFSSDELWSTPLFQTLLAAMEVGISREDIDQIILQSHFGLGRGMKMRQMAEVTIETAKTLFPDGAHAAIFAEKFKVHNIIEATQP